MIISKIVSVISKKKYHIFSLFSCIFATYKGVVIKNGKKFVQ